MKVIYQRQIQKGNLATLTVDAKQSSTSGLSTGFTKEELRDCFTIKEGCKCDTKNKVGRLWPSYGGTRACLASRGCVDEALLSLIELSPNESDGAAAAPSDSLNFVHIVDDNDNESSESLNGNSPVAEANHESYTSDEEFEFEDTSQPQVSDKRARKSVHQASDTRDPSDDDAMAEQSCSSEEEFEFEDEYH